MKVSLSSFVIDWRLGNEALILYPSLNQFPKSIALQRELQNGKWGARSFPLSSNS